MLFWRNFSPAWITLCRNLIDSTVWLADHSCVGRELEEAFDITIPTVEIIPANFNSAEDMWTMIVRLQEEG